MTPPSNRPSLTSSRLTGVTAAPHLPPFIIPLTTRELAAPPPGPRDVPTALTTHSDSPQLHDVTASAFVFIILDLKGSFHPGT